MKPEWKEAWDKVVSVISPALLSAAHRVYPKRMPSTGKATSSPHVSGVPQSDSPGSPAFYGSVPSDGSLKCPFAGGCVCVWGLWRMGGWVRVSSHAYTHTYMPHAYTQDTNTNTHMHTRHTQTHMTHTHRLSGAVVRVRLELKQASRVCVCFSSVLTAHRLCSRTSSSRRGHISDADACQSPQGRKQ